MRRNSIFLLILLYLLMWGAPVRAETTPVRTGPAHQNKCAEQVFAGGTVLYTLDYGATYLVPLPMTLYVLRNVYACPITSAVKLGQYQALGFRIDQNAMVVYVSTDGTRYYVHRGWKVYELTAAQWRQIVAAVGIKVAH